MYIKSLSHNNLVKILFPQFNWYTKRVTLAGVYKSTEVFMVQDQSIDYEQTWQFLDRRMHNLGKFGKFTRGVNSVFTSAYKMHRNASCNNDSCIFFTE